MTQKTMWVYKSRIGDKETFRLLGLSIESPFIEAVYDPENKRLVILNKQKVMDLKQVPRLDNKGKVVGMTLKDSENYFEHAVEDVQDIKDFVNLHVINVEHKALDILNE